MSNDDENSVREYRGAFTAWQEAAAKVLAAHDLIALSGGYREAFVLLDALFFVETGAAALRRNVSDLDMQYQDKMRESERTARVVLAAQRLIELTSGQEEAFMLLDAVLVATEGERAHEEIAEAHSICARNHEQLAAEKGEDPPETPAVKG